VAKSEVSGVPVMIKKTASGATFVFDGKTAPGFDQFVQERLKGLFQEFNKDRGA
jgi:ParB family chromosome partitioning protein